jgi:hypothetical protein
LEVLYSARKYAPWRGYRAGGSPVTPDGAAS